MDTEIEAQDRPRVRSGAARGLRLLTLAGIEIRLDASVLVIFALVVVSLANGALWTWHPDWLAATRWGVALVAGMLFFGSILLHELAHALVAKLNGIDVPRITLFLFGGVSETAEEPASPGSELAITIVGPLASFAIGLACTAVGVSVAGGGAFVQLLRTAPAEALASLGVASTLLLWLGPVNLMLGIFNLVPGFPLDGGRVLRAFLWWATGDLYRATRNASWVGQGVAFLLVAWGVLRALGGDLGGLWVALIGWFLLQAARATSADALVRHALRGVFVRDLMRTRFEDVPADMSLGRFVRACLLRGAQTVWPVTRAGEVVGLVSLADVAAVPEDARDQRPVGDVMHPIEQPLRPDGEGTEAVRALAAADVEALPVVDHGKVVGLLHRGDLVRWLALMDPAASHA